jgi:hypothetical protein
MNFSGVFLGYLKMLINPGTNNTLPQKLLCEMIASYAFEFCPECIAANLIVSSSEEKFIVFTEQLQM